MASRHASSKGIVCICFIFQLSFSLWNQIFYFFSLICPAMASVCLEVEYHGEMVAIAAFVLRAYVSA